MRSREAVAAHVRTPYVLIVPHGCILARTVLLKRVAEAMATGPDGQMNYVKIVGPSTEKYAKAVLLAM